MRSIFDDVQFSALTLPRYPQRSARLRVDLERIGIPVTFFEGVEGTQVALTQRWLLSIPRRLACEMPWRPNQLAGNLGHRRIDAHFLQTDRTYLVVLEEDVFLDENFLHGLRLILASHVEFDVIQLGYSDVYDYRDVEFANSPAIDMGNGRGIYRINGTHAPWGAFGMLYSRRFVERRWRDQGLFPIEPADFFFFNRSRRTYAVKPPLVHHDYTQVSVVEGRSQEMDAVKNAVVDRRCRDLRKRMFSDLTRRLIRFSPLYYIWVAFCGSTIRAVRQRGETLA